MARTHEEVHAHNGEDEDAAQQDHRYVRERHHGLYSCGLYSYGLHGYGLCSCGLYSYGLHSYGLYSYGLYSYGLLSTTLRRVPSPLAVLAPARVCPRARGHPTQRVD